VAAYSVLYDACVLYPAPLRDLLLRLAVVDLFRARWTETILDECFRNLAKNRWRRGMRGFRGCARCRRGICFRSEPGDGPA
jgi:hypothetical protein